MQQSRRSTLGSASSRRLETFRNRFLTVEISSCQGHDNSNTSLFKTFHSHTRARDGGKRERERKREAEKKKKERKKPEYISSKLLWNSSAGDCQFAQSGEGLQNCLVNPRWVTRALHKKEMENSVTRPPPSSPSIPIANSNKFVNRCVSYENVAGNNVWLGSGLFWSVPLQRIE